MRRSGAELLCRELGRQGVEHVFGVAGSSLVELWEAIRRDSRLRIVAATSELTASFMANGYARATGKPAVLCTIAGPGVTFASSGIAEARLGSVPLVYVVDAAPEAAVPVDDVLPLLAKNVIDVATADAVTSASRAAFACAREGEPGPVVLRVHAGAFEGSARADRPETEQAPRVATFDLGAVAERISRARRPVLLVGVGAAEAADEVAGLAERLTAPVVSTTSGRGVVSESHSLSLVFDAPWSSVEALNDVLERADLILALGCKLSRNGSRGYGLVLPSERLVRVDSSPEALDDHYPASVEIECDVGLFLSALEESLPASPSTSDWTKVEIESIRGRLDAETSPRLDPTLGPGSARDFFAALRRQLPETGIVTTDSGLHQYVARAHFRVAEPRTLLVPTGFQSMGFGIPAAIGARLATGEPTVAIIGDGGLAIVGLELITAVREQVPLTVVVLVDGYFGLIRVSQRARTGRETGVDVTIPDLPTFARSVGVEHVALDGSRDTDELLAAAIASDGVTLVEVATGDPPDLRRLTTRGRAYATTRRVLGGDRIPAARRVRKRR